MRKLSKDEFIERSKETHGDKYDYSLVDYKDINTKIKIICPIHGEFEQHPKSHLKGCNCKKCYHSNRITKNNILLNKFKNVHGNKYDYSLVEYTGSKNKIRIICPSHGTFEQKVSNHLSGFGCWKCSKTLTEKEFIDKSILIHGDKYDYSKVKYIDSRFKVIIICKKHGDFEQVANSHLMGNGCPICRESFNEKEISKILEDIGISYIRQKKFENCKNVLNLSFDFFLPDKNICIEYNGEQHYSPIDHFGGLDRLIIQRKRDRIKKTFCKTHNIRLITLHYKHKNIKIILEKLLLP